MADGPRYLRVPYAEKDAAKRLGALWDSGRRLWYVPSHGVSVERERELLSTWGTNPTGATSRRAAAAISAPTLALTSPARSLPGANNKHCASRPVDMYDRSFDGLAEVGGTASTHEVEERCRDVSAVAHMLQEGCRVGASGYLVGDGFVVSDDEDGRRGVENYSDPDSASCGEASVAESGSEYVPTDEDDDADALSVEGEGDSDGVNDSDDGSVI